MENLNFEGPAQAEKQPAKNPTEGAAAESVTIDYADTVENIALLPSKHLRAECLILEAAGAAAYRKLNELAPHRERLVLSGDNEGVKQHDEVVGVQRREAETCEARRLLVEAAAKLAEERELEEIKMHFWRETEVMSEQIAQKIADAYPKILAEVCELAMNAHIIESRIRDAHARKPKDLEHARLSSVEYLALQKCGSKATGGLFRDIVLFDPGSGFAHPIDTLVKKLIATQNLDEHSLMRRLPSIPTVWCKVLKGTINDAGPGQDVEVGLDEVDALVARGIVERI